MKNSKFSFNAFLLVVSIFTLMTLLITVVFTGAADRSAVNSINPIEGTEISVRYSSLKPCGLYVGDENTGVLKLEGKYGYDWGVAVEDNRLYINEYTNTKMGLLFCRFVRVNTDSFAKEVLLKNTMLRGRCRSGELVLVRNPQLSANFPETNSLLKLYKMSASDAETSETQVLFYDTEKDEVVYTVKDNTPNEKLFTSRYLERTLEEIRQ